jgi:hypothetical protein
VRLCFWMLLYPLIMGMVPASVEATDHPVTVNCDVHHGACSQTVSGVDVTFDISPKPVKAMTDLKFKITLKGKQPETPPYIDLGMPGMKMGPNRVSLQATKKGVYEGVGIIVRCPSGKRIWRAKIILPDLGEAEFVFDVIY